MRADWPLFVVKPSVVISSLCYSVFKLEPYGSCPFGCAYCYARWYRAPQPLSWRTLLKLWEGLARALSRLDLPPPYFRLSTLAEPFQQVEERARVSLRMMEVARRWGVPLVINTKSTLLRRTPWLDAALKLADEGLALVQVSVSVLDEALARALEPGAPAPAERLAAAEELSEHGVPVVARVQPLVPGLEDQHVEAALAALDHGCGGVIVEPLRETAEGLAGIAAILGLDPGEYAAKYRWEPYPSLSGEPGLLRPGLEWRRRMLERLAGAVSGKGVLTVCKDGIWPGARYGFDCCQAWRMGARYSLRRTLYEHVLKPETPPPNVHLLSEGEYAGYPRPVRRGLKLHHNKLAKVLGSERLLSALAGGDPWSGGGRATG